ncbi:hypothetical protein GX48_06411 [Paracoccidioides brasiliensis]|nr:hypothetical protein GX48_06411 [Paracoccidioides brasiliensis]
MHIYKDKKLQLRVVTSAEVSLAESAELLEHSNLLESIKSGDVWTSSKSNLELKISVRIENSLHGIRSSPDWILEEIKISLIKSQLWHTLQFSRLSQEGETLTSQDGFCQLNLVFEFQKKMVHIPSPKPPRMPYSLEIHSAAIEPPPGVTRLCLQEIAIAFNFSSISMSNGHDDGLGNVSRSSSFEDLTFISPPPCGFLVDTVRADPTVDDIYSSIDGSQTTARTDEDWMSLDYDSPFSSQQTSSSIHCTVVTHQHTKPHHTCKSTSQLFMTLLDTGFRTLLCQTPPRIPSNITTVVEKIGPSLADFAPTIFNPGYDASVFQRARFIPMISKGIAAMLDHASPAGGIQLKHPILNPVDIGKACDPESKGKGAPNPTSNRPILKSLLWKSMQRRLLNPEAVRKLPSITATDDVISHPQSYGDEFSSLPPTPVCGNVSEFAFQSSLRETAKSTIPAMTSVSTNLDLTNPSNAAHISDTEWCFSENSDGGDVTLLTDQGNDDHIDSDDYFTDPFQIHAMHITIPDTSLTSDDRHHDLLDNNANTRNYEPQSYHHSVLEDDLIMQEVPNTTSCQHPLSNPHTASLKNSDPTPPSPSNSGMEILDPSSQILISGEFMLPPATYTFNTNEDGEYCDSEMLLL